MRSANIILFVALTRLRLRVLASSLVDVTAATEVAPIRRVAVTITDLARS